MSFWRDQRGFVFSLDATLGIVVVMIVMAGVARAGASGLVYEQYGYLRLQRYANDALEVLYNTGILENDKVVYTIDNIRSLLLEGKLSEAESLAENELRKILPPEIQFRMRVGPEASPLLDNVYPTPGNEEAWRSAFDNAKEIAVATRVVIIGENFEPMALYVWRWPAI